MVIEIKKDNELQKAIGGNCTFEYFPEEKKVIIYGINETVVENVDSVDYSLHAAFVTIKVGG